MFTTTRSIELNVIICCLAMSVGLVGCDSTSPSAEADETVEKLIEEREKLDETVWANEVSAQQYERTFVELWDNLRNAQDKTSVLASFPFEELTLREAGKTEELDLGVKRTRYDGKPKTWSKSQFASRLKQLQQSGYQIVDTEWHHSSFSPDEEGAPRSVVSMALNLKQKRASGTERRLIVRADLQIKWQPSSESDTKPVVESITAKNVRVFDRVGESAFEEILSASGDSEQFLSANPVLVYDLENDGLSEIVIPRWNRVYRNEGKGAFRKEALLAYPDHLSEAGVLADFTGDGRADLFSVLKDSHAVLYEGDENGRFETEGRQCADVEFTMPSATTAGDIDGDGDLDLWVTQYKLAYMDGQMPTPIYDANDGEPSYLLINDGSGKFQDATVKAGLADKRFRRSYSASFFDFDDDDDLDLIVVSDFAGVDLYENDGKGHFTDATEKWIGPRHLFGMAHTFGDYDLDGDLDFYAIGMSSTTARRLDGMKLGRADREDITRLRSQMGYGNRMYMRNKSRYTAPKFAASVARTGWSWGTTSFDFDNDGDSEIYVANGHRSGKSTQDYCTTFWCHDIYTGNSVENKTIESLFSDSLGELQQGKISWNGYEKNVLFLNDGGGDFNNVAFLFGASFEYDSRAVVSDDFDGDGRKDLLVSKYIWAKDGFETIHYVYRNTLETKNHWIGVRLREQPGLSPIGANITVKTAAGTQIARIVTGDSFLSQHSNTAHFGLGEFTKVESIEVVWPDGKKTTIENPTINQYHDVTARLDSSQKKAG